MSYRRPARRGVLTSALIATVVLAIVGVAFYFWVATAPVNPEEPLVIDWKLKITIHDARTQLNYSIPSGIGVAGGIWNNHTLDAFGPQGYAPISTRDATGTVWVQSTEVRLYTFGDFFNVWGVPFDTDCVPDGQGGIYCSTQFPPVMSDGENDSCIKRNANLSNGKDWLVIVGSSAGGTLCRVQ